MHKTVTSYAILKTEKNCWLINIKKQVRQQACYATASNSECPSSHGTKFRLPHCKFYTAHPASNAAAVTPHKPKFTKMGEAHPRCMQNFMPISFSAAEKPVTIHRTYKMKNKMTNKQKNT